MKKTSTTKLTWNEDVFNRALQETCRGKLAIVGITITNDVKISFRGEKSGRQYVKSDGKVHTASAPGETPAIDTGRLRASISYDVTDGKSGGATGQDPGVKAENYKWPVMEVAVGTKVDYALDLEFGRKPGEARPFLVPALDRAVEPIKRIFSGQQVTIKGNTTEP